MSFDFGIEERPYPGLLLALCAQSRSSSREPATKSSAGVPRVFADVASRALSGGCTRPLVMLVVGRDREAAAPSRMHHEASVQPLGSVRGAV